MRWEAPKKAGRNTSSANMWCLTADVNTGEPTSVLSGNMPELSLSAGSYADKPCKCRQNIHQSYNSAGRFQRLSYPALGRELRLPMVGQVPPPYHLHCRTTALSSCSARSIQTPAFLFRTARSIYSPPNNIKSLTPRIFQPVSSRTFSFLLPLLFHYVWEGNDRRHVRYLRQAAVVSFRNFPARAARAPQSFATSGAQTTRLAWRKY